MKWPSSCLSLEMPGRHQSHTSIDSRTTDNVPVCAVMCMRQCGKKRGLGRGHISVHLYEHTQPCTLKTIGGSNNCGSLGILIHRLFESNHHLESLNFAYMYMEPFSLISAEGLHLSAFHIAHVLNYTCVIINPHRACAARVTVLGMSVCPLLFWRYGLRGGQ